MPFQFRYADDSDALSLAFIQLKANNDMCESYWLQKQQLLRVQNDIKTSLQDPQYEGLVATYHQKPVGCLLYRYNTASCNDWSNSVTLDSMHVLPSWQGGTGEALIKSFMALKHDIDHVIVNSAESAKGFYSKMGFKNSSQYDSCIMRLSKEDSAMWQSALQQGCPGF